jgi:hypothetical protein
MAAADSGTANIAIFYSLIASFLISVAMKIVVAAYHL